MIADSESFYEKSYTYTISCLFYRGSDDIFCSYHEIGEYAIVHIEDITDFFFWHYENMSELDGINIQKGIQFFVFVDFV